MPNPDFNRSCLSDASDTFIGDERPVCPIDGLFCVSNIDALQKEATHGGELTPHLLPLYDASSCRPGMYVAGQVVCGVGNFSAAKITDNGSATLSDDVMEGG